MFITINEFKLTYRADLNASLIEIDLEENDELSSLRDKIVDIASTHLTNEQRELVQSKAEIKSLEDKISTLKAEVTELQNKVASGDMTHSEGIEAIQNATENATGDRPNATDVDLGTGTTPKITFAKGQRTVLKGKEYESLVDNNTEPPSATSKNWKVIK